MNKNLVAVLLVLGLLGLAASQVINETGERESQLLLPELKDRLSQVEMVSLEQLGNPATRITLKFQKDEWRLIEKASYTADFEALAKLLSDLSIIAIAEVKTARPENHARLGVADEGAKAGKMITVTSGDAQFQLVFGLDAESLGTYVRRPDETQIYLSDIDVELPLGAIDWLDAVVVNIDSAEVMSVAISITGASTLKVLRHEEGAELELQSLPVGAELAYETVVDNFGRLLVNLRFTDVKPYREAEFVTSSKAEISLRTGELINAQTIDQDGEYWLHLDRADNIGWQYRVSEYTYNEFNKTLPDMLETDILKTNDE